MSSPATTRSPDEHNVEPVITPPAVMAPDVQMDVKVPTEVMFGWAAVDKVPVKFVAETVVRPLTVDGNPTVRVPLDSATSTSLDVPLKDMVPPSAMAVEFPLPSANVITQLANILFSTASATIVTAPAELRVTSPETATGL